MENNFDLVKRLLSLPWYNLILISVLVVPIFIGTWITLLTALSITLSEHHKRVFVLSVVLIYIIGLTVGKWGREIEEKNKEDLIIEVLKHDLKDAKGILGFQRIRFKHPSFDDNLLYSIANKYPDDFCIEPIANPINNTERDPNDPIGLKLR